MAHSDIGANTDIQTASETKVTYGSNGSQSQRKSNDLPQSRGLMTIIEPISEVVNDPQSGLPRGHFSCYGESKDIIYDFRATVERSKIPNAGFGAFLTYLGARKRERHKSSILGWKNSSDCEEIDVQSVEYSDSVHVHLGMCRRQKGTRSGTDNIGVLYEPVPGIEFSTLKPGCGLIDFGPYGPFREQDLKRMRHFEVKSFIFNLEPAEWCFGVSEQLFGESQVVDITDDTTGKPHDIAAANLPMYVNEVGHNKNYTQTVLALEEDDDQSVHYYLNIESSMKQGDTIELLTDYFAEYEEVRERKGYGLKNLQNGLHLGDSVSKWNASMEERAHIEGLVKSLGIKSLFRLMEFVECNIRRPLAEVIDIFLRKVGDISSSKDAGVLTPLDVQWIAICRIHWLSSAFSEQVEMLGKMHRGIIMSSNEKMIEQCKFWLENMKRVKIYDLLVGNREESTKKLILRELHEQIFYNLKDKLALPLEASIWCPIARDLIESLCTIILNTLSSCNSLSINQDLANTLVSEFYSVARSAAKRVRFSCTSGANNDLYLCGLEFESNVPSKSNLSMQGRANKYPNSSFENDIYKCFGKIKVLEFDKLALDITNSVGGADVGNCKANKYIIARRSVGAADIWGSPKSLITSETLSHNSSFDVYETWYIQWQVLYIVHVFAQHYLSKGGYSLEKMCQEVGGDVSVEAASQMIAEGKEMTMQIVSKWIGSGDEQKRCESPQKIADKRRQSTQSCIRYNPTFKKIKMSVEKGANKKPRIPAKRIWSGEPDEPLEGGWPPGWRKEIYQRQSGATKGTTDKYWYSPSNKKFRSMAEVRRYFADQNNAGADAPKSCSKSFPAESNATPTLSALTIEISTLDTLAVTNGNKVVPATLDLTTANQTKNATITKIPSQVSQTTALFNTKPTAAKSTALHPVGVNPTTKMSSQADLVKSSGMP